ncbi:hypothetical protein J2857_003597 [Neorhizobium galegae]|uniref:Rieske (2Fe-2S) protein n=1 Tax=Neorhizobium galegae TaxID=399 RepID=UPI001AE1AD8B|nr:Rieske 2Fe-2S domain-containing protein [Neorhizobium galegae]MBP2560828.1 hypothetical protein [Neorhizobium galegae]
MITRLDQLTGPVEVGKHYLVPTVTAWWRGSLATVPVIGPKHHDRHCLNFDHEHYHLDPRFVRAPPFKHPSSFELFWRDIQARPLMTGNGVNPDGLPEPVWMRRKCHRLGNPHVGKMLELTSKNGNWQCHFREWAGKQAKHDGRGWVCPHRNIPLADHPPVDGVITCPAHLLRIDAATGLVLTVEGVRP